MNDPTTDWTGWRVEKHNRCDQRGFTLRHNGARRFSLTYWTIWRYKRRPRVCWMIKVALGSGAGYIGGLTAYVCWRCRGGKGPSVHGPWPVFRAGLTRNANHVPYNFGG